jgi:hypothetical protein
MNRTLRLVSACLVFSVFACGDNEARNDVTITFFTAAPDAIELGQSTKLLFVVDPLDAKVTITEVGDVSGKQQVTVKPTSTTAYHLTATSGTRSATADATVNVGAPRLVVTLPPDANAGFPVSVTVKAVDSSGNQFNGYTKSVSFTSTDTGTGAVTPGTLTLQNGVGTTTATFVTLGSQTITVTDSGTPVLTGKATSTCHGLVYTAPTAGRVRLVANASSTAQLVQLDLIANERLEVSSFFGGGPGSFAAGMNLPIDTSRAAAAANLFEAGNALVIQPPGTPPPAPILPLGAGVLNTTDHTLYTAVSRRRVAGPVFNQETEVQGGRVFFSIRLKLTQNGTPGPVFDGAQPSPQFVAAVRDQFGDNFVSPADFGIGRLAIQ